MAGVIIFLTDVIIRMKESLIEKARRLPEPESYFRGLAAGDDIRLPSSLLLYWHDYPHERTIISTRHMLILPALPMEYIVSGSRIGLDSGHALLVKPYLRRSVPETRERYDRLIVSFEAPEEAFYLPAEPVMEAGEESQRIAERLVEAYLAGDTLRAIFELVLLLRELSRHPVRQNVPPLSRPVRQALNRINQALELPLSIKELAAEAGLSASHFRRRFREELGLSLGDYLAERRLNAARRLLEDTPLPITEIARSCGYDTIYAFSRFFRKRTGLSPSGWRNSREPGPPRGERPQET